MIKNNIAIFVKLVAITGLVHFISSCQKKLTNEDEINTTQTIDTVYSDVGEYAQLSFGNFWKYQNLKIVFNDSEPFNIDTTILIQNLEITKDTLFNNQQYFKTGNSYFYNTNGEYFKKTCNSADTCFTTKYLNTNLTIGGTWKFPPDSIYEVDTICNSGQFSYKIIDIHPNYTLNNAVYNDVFEILEGYVSKSEYNGKTRCFPQQQTYFYAKGVGLILRKSEGVNTYNRTELLAYKI